MEMASVTDPGISNGNTIKVIANKNLLDDSLLEFLDVIISIYLES